MSVADLDGDLGAPPGPDPPQPPNPPPDEWRTSSDGRVYVPRTDGVPGIIYRFDTDETVAQARERMKLPRDQRPKPKQRKPRTPKLTDEKPKQADLKALEATLAEALKAPAMVCAMVGDEWSATHFTNAGPYLARNLVLASEHNPWLRRKLEEAATGEDAMMLVVSLVGVAGAVISYTLPPIVYWLNLPVAPKVREMFGIPDRKHPPRPPEYTADANGPYPPAASAESPAGAFAA
jgi:hypothetical protein